MQNTSNLAIAGLMAMGLAACGNGNEPTYQWVDWETASEEGASGNGGSISVEYSGDLNANSTPDGEAEDLFSPWAATFTSEGVIDSPEGGDILRMYGGDETGLQTVSFSPPARDPVLAVVSLGSTSEPARILFDTEIEVLSSGPGKWGSGSLTVAEDGTTLLGQEAYGLVRIEGTYERLSFEIPDYEADYGLQIAVRPAVE